MPLYVYEVVLPDGTGGERFERFQKMADAPLTVHPETGEPVRRVISEPNAPRAWTDAQGKAATSDANLAAKGFTKYVKTGDGSYEKTAGTGPKKIRRK
jgi:hypothetical protein